MKKNWKYFIFLLLSMVVGTINGVFGGGGGILCIPIFKKLLDFDDKEAHATSVLVMSIISIPTLLVYLISLEYQWSQLIFVTIGSLLGGFIGSLLLKKLSNKVINILYIIVLFLSGIKMFF